MENDQNHILNVVKNYQNSFGKSYFRTSAINDIESCFVHIGCTSRKEHEISIPCPEMTVNFFGTSLGQDIYDFVFPCLPENFQIVVGSNDGAIQICLVLAYNCGMNFQKKETRQIIRTHSFGCWFWAYISWIWRLVFMAQFDLLWIKLLLCHHLRRVLNRIFKRARLFAGTNLNSEDLKLTCRCSPSRTGSSEITVRPAGGIMCSGKASRNPGDFWSRERAHHRNPSKKRTSGGWVFHIPGTIVRSEGKDARE
jgi:hypothetical protein